MKINTAIKKLRTFLGASQQDFATGLGISTRGLANYESNRMPPLVILGRLSKIAKDIKNVHDAGLTEDGHSIGALPDGVASVISTAFLLELKKAKIQTLVNYDQDAAMEGGIHLQRLRDLEEYGYTQIFSDALEGLRSRYHRDLAREVLRAMVVLAQPLMRAMETDKTRESLELGLTIVKEETKRKLVGLPEELRREAGISEEDERELFGADGIEKGKKK